MPDCEIETHIPAAIAYIREWAAQNRVGVRVERETVVEEPTLHLAFMVKHGDDLFGQRVAIYPRREFLDGWRHRIDMLLGRVAHGMRRTLASYCADCERGECDKQRPHVFQGKLAHAS